MQRKNIKEVLERVRSGDYTQEDETIAKYWIHQFRQDEEVELSKAEWLEVKHKIWAELESGKLLSKPRTARLWPRIFTVAAAIATIVFGVWFFDSSNFIQKSFEDPALAYQNDVAPGKNGAILKLANGNIITLSDAKNGVVINSSSLVYDDGTDVESGGEHKEFGNELQNLVIETPKGRQYEVILPDGSRVWLNAASSLKFPSSFGNGERHVEITGEAYFEVAKDPKRRFKVSSAGQEVTVLGTHFNINSYKDEPVVKTTLMEGSVRVNLGDRIQTIEPGEQVVNNGAELTVLKVNTALVIDWKDGAFNLDEVDFRVAMREIARWYDIEIVYDEALPQDIQAWGWISKNSKLSSVLKLIENSGQVKFRLEGKRLYVYK